MNPVEVWRDALNQAMLAVDNVFDTMLNPQPDDFAQALIKLRDETPKKYTGEPQPVVLDFDARITKMRTLINRLDQPEELLQLLLMVVEELEAKP